MIRFLSSLKTETQIQPSCLLLREPSPISPSLLMSFLYQCFWLETQRKEHVEGLLNPLAPANKGKHTCVRNQGLPTRGEGRLPILIRIPSQNKRRVTFNLYHHLLSFLSVFVCFVYLPLSSKMFRFLTVPSILLSCRFLVVYWYPDNSYHCWCCCFWTSVFLIFFLLYQILPSSFLPHC